MPFTPTTNTSAKYTLLLFLNPNNTDKRKLTTQIISWRTLENLTTACYCWIHKWILQKDIHWCVLSRLELCQVHFLYPESNEKLQYPLMDCILQLSKWFITVLWSVNSLIWSGPSQGICNNQMQLVWSFRRNIDFFIIKIIIFRVFVSTWVHVFYANLSIQKLFDPKKEQTNKVKIIHYLLRKQHNRKIKTKCI